MDTYALKSIPSIYVFPELKTARLTYAYHCCSFRHPQTHDPYAHDEHLRLQAELNARCARKQLPTAMSVDSSAATPQPDTTTAANEFQGSFDDIPAVPKVNPTHVGSQHVVYEADTSSQQVTIDSSHASIDGIIEEIVDTTLASGVPLPPASNRSKLARAQTAQRLATYWHNIECGELAEMPRGPNALNISCSPEPDAFNPCEDIMGYSVLRFAVWLVTGLSVFGNLSVIVVLAAIFNRLSVPKFLQLNLAIGDLMMGVYLAMLAIKDMSTKGSYFNHAIDWQHGLGCSIAGASSLFASQLSIFTLSVITFERYYTITYSIDLNMRLQLGWAARIMFFGWLFAFTSAILPVLADVNSYAITSICLPMRTDYAADRLFLLVLLVIDSSAFVIIFACYLRMYLLILRQKTEATAKERTVAKRMALLVSTDFACWAPIIFFSTTALFGMPLISVTNSKILIVFFYPLNSMANPFLYVLSTRQYKRDVEYLSARWQVWRKSIFNRNNDSYYSGNNNIQAMLYQNQIAMQADNMRPQVHHHHNLVGAADRQCAFDYNTGQMRRARIATASGNPAETRTTRVGPYAVKHPIVRQPSLAASAQAPDSASKMVMVSQAVNELAHEIVAEQEQQLRDTDGRRRSVQTQAGLNEDNNATEPRRRRVSKAVCCCAACCCDCASTRRDRHRRPRGSSSHGAHTTMTSASHGAIDILGNLSLATTNSSSYATAKAPSSRSNTIDLAADQRSLCASLCCGGSSGNTGARLDSRSVEANKPNIEASSCKSQQDSSASTNQLLAGQADCEVDTSKSELELQKPRRNVCRHKAQRRRRRMHCHHCDHNHAPASLRLQAEHRSRSSSEPCVSRDTTSFASRDTIYATERASKNRAAELCACTASRCNARRRHRPPAKYQNAAHGCHQQNQNSNDNNCYHNSPRHHHRHQDQHTRRRRRRCSTCISRTSLTPTCDFCRNITPQPIGDAAASVVVQPSTPTLTSNSISATSTERCNYSRNKNIESNPTNNDNTEMDDEFTTTNTSCISSGQYTCGDSYELVQDPAALRSSGKVYRAPVSSVTQSEHVQVVRHSILKVPGARKAASAQHIANMPRPDNQQASRNNVTIQGTWNRLLSPISNRFGVFGGGFQGRYRTSLISNNNSSNEPEDSNSGSWSLGGAGPANCKPANGRTKRVIIAMHSN